MIEIKEKKLCCGCHACYNICPKNAISMVEDEKGFKYPIVNKEKCINCGLCEKVCPILNSNKTENDLKAFAVINKDNEIRLNSSSGGVFYLLAKYILENSGIVYGAAFSDDFSTVNHIEVDKIENLSKLMTSKYLQSNIGRMYINCKKNLDNNRLVLFTGTPCQIEGLLKYLKKDYKNLYTQDVICHGCPSPKIWKMYLNKLNRNYNDLPIKTNFRQKKSGWNSYELSVRYTNSSYECVHGNDFYMKSFLYDFILRESCFDCRFKKYNRLSDITLGDFWGIDNIDKDMNDNKGTSLVIIHSKKGADLFNIIKKDTIYKEVDFYKSIKFNSAYYKSVKMPKKREEFFQNINDENFNELVYKYTKSPWYLKLKYKIFSLKHKIKYFIKRK